LVGLLGYYWAVSVNKIDMPAPKPLVESDFNIIANMSVFNYFKNIFREDTGMVSGDRVNN
jgi:hypothetical protein